MTFKETLSKKKIAVILLLAIFLIILDRGFKALSLFSAPQNLQIFPGLDFSYQLNPNIAFSLPLSGSWLTAGITLLLVVLMVISFHLYHHKKRQSALFIWLIILGSASNLYDRFRYHGVIDYLHFFNFSVLNLADIVICLAVIVMFLHLYLPSKKIN